MNKSFALLALLAFAEAVQLDCGPCGGCGCGCEEEDEPETDIIGVMKIAYMYENKDCTGEKLELAISENPYAIVEYDAASL